jgi:hypothetical protein
MAPMHTPFDLQLAFDPHPDPSEMMLEQSLQIAPCTRKLNVM